ncbi:hypothetical protein HPB51_009749 [Rhipicephalus microplus]|uniref:Kinetochore protein SPC25 n=1 Tax=Rhipicephalus microplus TaxID=6941 RepID=A0A9J6F137_RHIMP|nr:hypothetical protein HPB51_009749 [Rhipicephalus microplus]
MRPLWNTAFVDEIEDLVDLMRRYQQMLEMEKRDVEHMTALADICDKKQKRLELHTLASECEPALASLDELVTELRQTCNLTQFVHRLRREFKKLLLAHPPSAETAQIEHNDAVASA